MGVPDIKLKIWGADEDYIASETPDTSQSYFTGLSGLTAMTLQCIDGGFEPVLEAEETVYADNRAYVTKTISGVFKVVLTYRNYPATSSSIATFLPELAALNKLYTWIIIDGYNIGFETANVARAVNLMSWNVERFHDLTRYTFEFNLRKPL